MTAPLSKKDIMALVEQAKTFTAKAEVQQVAIKEVADRLDEAIQLLAPKRKTARSLNLPAAEGADR